MSAVIPGDVDNRSTKDPRLAVPPSPLRNGGLEERDGEVLSKLKLRKGCLQEWEAQI